MRTQWHACLLKEIWMLSFEQMTDKHLKANNYIYKNYCNSTTEPDFVLALKNHRFSIDVKEKRQKYKGHWTDKIPEQHLFIIDDLAARKTFIDGPYSAIVVADRNSNKYYIFDALTMSLMPKTRVNRRLAGGSLKGKWLVDLRNAEEAESLEEVMKLLKNYAHFCDKKLCLKPTECLFQFRGENVDVRGTTRTKNQRQHDFSNK